MAEIGIFFSSEERSAPEIVAAAAHAEQAGFRSAWLSDHFHPWTDAQGESPFVWSVLGAAARATQRMRWMTAVTCPTVRTHPGIVAHAAATTATLLPGRFRLGVGSGEALNEHIFGDRWPEANVRLEMLEEAVHVIRLLWEGGFRHHHGRHYTLEGARLYSLPDDLPPILVSGFGPKAVELAARIGDGFVSVGPDREGLEHYRSRGGAGTTTSGLKVCWGEDRDACVRTVHRLWPNEALSGELAQILPSPRHFEQATALVTEEHISEAIACGPDPQEHIAAIQEVVDAGFDEVHVGHIGPGHDGFVDFYAREVLPHFAGAAAAQPSMPVAECGAPTGLDSGRAALAQVDRQQRHRADRQELRLPVLQRALPELRGAEIPDVVDTRLAVRELVGAVVAPARDRLGKPRAQPDRAHHEQQRVGVDPQPHAPQARRRAQRGESARACSSTRWSRSLSVPALARLLGLGRAVLDEPDGQQDVERELQVLRLPVLHHGVAEGRRDEVAPELDRFSVVDDGLVVVLMPAGDGLPHERRDEERQEDERQAVGTPPPASAQWWVKPTTE